MTAYPSDRPSDRVGEPTPTPTEFSGLPAPRAPGSIARAGSVPPVPERTGRRTPAIGLDRIERSLTDRDQAVLSDLDRFGFLTTRHLQLLHFSAGASELAAARRTYRALDRLTELGVVDHLERRVGGVRAGSASFVWRVGPVGYRLLRADSTARLRRKEPGLRTLDHRLAVADAGLQLILASRLGSFELLEFKTEPDTWHPFLGAGASRQVLKPDGFAVTASGEYEDYWFLEIDRATESLPTVLRKCLQYVRYAATGEPAQRYGVTPLVVWLVPDEQRRTAIERAIDSSQLDTRLFRVCLQPDLAPLVAGGAG